MDESPPQAGRRLRGRDGVLAALAVAAVAVLAAIVPAAHLAVSGPSQPTIPAAGTAMMYVSTTADTVVPVNVRTDRALAPINLNLPQSSFLVCMAITRNGKTIYVAAEDGRITPVRTATQTAGRPIVIDGHPGQIVLAPDGRTGYVVGDGGGFIPVNLVTGTIGKLVKDRAIERLVLAPGGKTAYGLSAAPTTTVVPVDLATGRPLRPITFRRLILQFTITPNGNSAWVYLGGTANTNELVKLNLTTRVVSAPIKLPDDTQQVAFGPRDTTAYAFSGSVITPIDLAARALDTPIAVPLSAAAWTDVFSLSPDGRSAIVDTFVRNRGVEVVSVNLATGIAQGPVFLGYKQWGPGQVAFAADSKTAYVGIVNDTPGQLLQGKLIPVSAATDKRVGQPIAFRGQPLQILVTQ